MEELWTSRHGQLLEEMFGDAEELLESLGLESDISLKTIQRWYSGETSPLNAKKNTEPILAAMASREGFHDFRALFLALENRLRDPKTVLKEKDIRRLVDATLRECTLAAGLAGIFERSPRKFNEDETATIGGVLRIAEKCSSLNPVIHAEELQPGSTRDKEATQRLADFLKEKIAGRARLSSDVTELSEAIETPGNLCFLLDAIDGTKNMRAGLPLYCSAAAAFYSGGLIGGAIYHGPEAQLYFTTSEWREEWELHGWRRTLFSRNVEGNPSSGLAASPDERLEHRPPRDEINWAFHLPSSSKELRIDTTTEIHHCFEALGRKMGRVHMLNSGQLALAMVARGGFNAFRNRKTNLWDVAAGHALIRSVGGEVYDYASYGSPEELKYVGRDNSHISVLAVGEKQKVDERVRELSGQQAPLGMEE